MSPYVLCLLTAAHHPGPAVKDLVGTVKDAITGIALLAGGLFTYFKFVKGRLLGPRVKLILTAHLLRNAAGAEDPAVRPGSGLAVEMRIQNDGQIQLVLPRDSEQIVSVSSATWDTVLSGAHLDSEPVSWKGPDALFAHANLQLSEGEQPTRPVTIEPGEEARFAVVFGVPPDHRAAVFLVTANAWVTYRSWFKRHGRWWDSRMLVMPEVATTAATSTAGES